MNFLALFKKKETNATTQALHSEHSRYPIAVQAFPMVDNFEYESEKQLVTTIAEPYFQHYEETFSRTLTTAADSVVLHNSNFHKYLLNAFDQNNNEKDHYEINMKKSLDELLACSPKKIVAEYQKYSLEAGWAYVQGYNAIIDELANCFPRCRAGIFQSRLKYSDVIQISDEILTTLRPCQIIMEDLQRRYELLEALQNHIAADLEYTECEKIMNAAKKTFADNHKYGQDQGFLKKMISLIMQPVTAIGDAMAIPTLQIQGQIQREDRLEVFLTTADMLQDGWKEWCDINKQLIEPHLKIMFELKRDYFKNQIISILDMATYNGYSLKGLHKRLQQKFL